MARFSHLVALWLSLVLPSLMVVHRVLGWPGVAVYVVAAAVAVAAFDRLAWPRSDRRARLLIVLTFAVLFATFFVVYPQVNTHTPGSGSDDDDAYNVGVRALVSGHSPYGERTYLGNQLHQLPGAFILAAPFVFLGTSALQNLFWLAAFFAVVWREAGASRSLRWLWLVLLASPTVLHQIVTGTGHAANTIYVVLGVWWLVASRGSLAASAGLGVALASRANFVAILPLAIAWVWRREGAAAAGRSAAASIGTFLLLAASAFWLSPGEFGPLEASERLSRFNAVLPHADVVIATLMAGASLGLAMRPLDRAGLFLACAVVQAIPVVTGLAFGVVRDARLDLAFATYATFFAWFVYLGADLSNAYVNLARATLVQKDHGRAIATR